MEVAIILHLATPGSSNIASSLLKMVILQLNRIEPETPDGNVSHVLRRLPLVT
jgi:hypothetical protein